jgi:hypothetical protein
MPCSATHTADSRVPDPHQILSISPGECGCTASMGPPGFAADIARNNARSRDRLPEKSSLVTGVVGLHRIPERLGALPGRLGRTPAHAQLQPASCEQVGCSSFFGHVKRVLVAHVDHTGADLDPACLHSDGRQQRKRRRELARKVMNSHEGSVDADLLRGHREFNRLLQRVGACVGHAAAGMPGSE